MNCANCHRLIKNIYYRQETIESIAANNTKETIESIAANHTKCTVYCTICTVTDMRAYKLHPYCETHHRRYSPIYNTTNRSKLFCPFNHCIVCLDMRLICGQNIVCRLCYIHISIKDSANNSPYCDNCRAKYTAIYRNVTQKDIRGILYSLLYAIRR